ncbi:MAG: hypothetical protein IT233_08935 [Bacteroidia bacterium]|nr:hypothetical protein [Bacteroidia bacterium]
MKVLRISLLTLVSGTLGFVGGYMLFGRYGDDMIPLEQIFFGDQVHDGILNSVLFLKPKIVGTALFMAFAGCVIAILLEVRGTPQAKGGNRLKNDTGFYECRWCGFKSRQRASFCEACGHDENGLTRDDYRQKAFQKRKGT